MILFEEDWNKYPSAIVHTSTANKSWLELAAKYKQMGIKNYYFHLALVNPLLADYDTEDENLPTEIYAMMKAEAEVNPWYALREVIKLPIKGRDGGAELLANRGNISFYWCMFNRIITYVQQIRQTGKSLNIRVLVTLFHHFLNRNSLHVLYTKSDLRAGEIAEYKDFREKLPFWVYLAHKEEADNQISFTTKSRENETITYIPSGNEVAANKVGRGKTPAFIASDETPFCSYCYVSVPALVSSAARSFEDAENDGRWYGLCYTTTAGDLSTKEGEFVHNQIKKKAAFFTETMFDLKDRIELVEYIQTITGEIEPKIDITFNHLQLGYSDDWLKRTISRNPGGRDAIIRDHLNRWTFGSTKNPIPEAYLEMIRKSVKDPKVDINQKWRIPTKYYASKEYIKTRVTAAGIDTSNASGNDNVCIVTVDVETAEVLMVSTTNNCNLIHFANFIALTLFEFPKLTIIPENKFNWKTIQDQLLLAMTELGLDPGRRIYSRVVDNAHGSDREKEIFKNYITGHASERKYRQYADSFGFPTNSPLRHLLFDKILKDAYTSTSKLVRDRDLIDELATLIEKNGVVDHSSIGTSDHVIAWLIVHWFLRHARNLSHYGIDAKMVLSKVEFLDLEVDPNIKYEKIRREKILSSIEVLEEKMDISRSQMERSYYSNRIKSLKMDLGDDSLSDHASIDRRLVESKDKKRRNFSMYEGDNGYFGDFRSGIGF